MITLLFLIFNSCVEAGFIKGTWGIIGNVFRGATWTIEKGFESVASLVIPGLESEPEPTVYDELLQNPPQPNVPWIQRVRPSMRGPPSDEVPYHTVPHHHFQHHSPYHQNLGYHWNQLISEAEAQHKFQNSQQQNYYPSPHSNSNILQQNYYFPPVNPNTRKQNYYPPPKNSKNQPPNYTPSANSNAKNQNAQPSRDRGETALQINKIIEELNTRYGNGNHTYSDEVYVIVKKIYNLLYKPDFDLRNEFVKRLLIDYIREIALVYNKELSIVRDGGNNGNSNGGSSNNSGTNINNTQPPKNEVKAPTKPSHMKEFNELIFMLEDMETSDVNLIFEYMNGFCTKYYKGKNGQFHYTVYAELFNMGEFIKSEFFEFPGDPSIIESPGNPSTLELVKYIRDIEKAFYSLPPEETASTIKLGSATSDLNTIEKELDPGNLLNNDGTFSNSRNTNLDLDFSSLLSLDFNIEDVIIFTATTSPLNLDTLESQSETNNGPFSWLPSLFNFGQSPAKSIENASFSDPIDHKSEEQLEETNNKSSLWLSNLFDVGYHVENFKKHSLLYRIYDSLIN